SGAETMSRGLEQVWWYTCKYENIDPVDPTRLPLLFALDEKLNVPGGSVYHREGEQVEALTRSARDRLDRARKSGGSTGHVGCGGGHSAGDGGGGGASCGRGGGGCGGGS